MDYQTEEVSLQRGLFVGEKQQTEAVIRESTVDDYINAVRASERVVLTPEGPMLLTSDAELGLQMLARRIVRIGEIQGPMDTKNLGKLTDNDLQLLRQAAELLDAAIMNDGMQRRGRDQKDGETTATDSTQSSD